MQPSNTCRLNKDFLMLKLRNIAILLVVAISSAIYGAAAAKYQLQPYPLIGYIKNIFFGTPVEKQDRYYNDRASFFSIHGKKSDLVMVGDSLTDGAEWEELLGSQGIVNRGIIGDTTYGLRLRLDSIYSTDAKKAFVMIGINDIIKGRATDEILKDYQEIVNGMISHNIRPYIQSTLLVGDSKKLYNEKVHELNRQMSRFASEQGIDFIDLNKSLSSGGVLRKEFTEDGIHLNGDGYTEWAKAIAPHLAAS